MFIDTHCHLTATDFIADQDDVITRAATVGVSAMVCIAEDVQSSIDATILSNKYEQIFCTVGVHPHKADTWNIAARERLLTLAQVHGTVKAIGEIGLDYHYNTHAPDVQQQALIEQLELAKQLTLPVILHNRDSWNDLWNIITAHQPNKAVVHCCTEPWANVSTWIEAGYTLSFTGIATFKNAHDVHNTIKQCPLEQLMIETDSPYLAPVPYRGKRNEPAYVVQVAECIAELKGISVDEVAERTTYNAQEFFGI
jgi:TatD DNase family protein